MVVGARLMWRYADRANPYAQQAYEELAAVLPELMKEPVREVAEGLGSKTQDLVWTKIFSALTIAWAERRKVRLRYTMQRTFETVVSSSSPRPRPIPAI